MLFTFIVFNNAKCNKQANCKRISSAHPCFYVKGNRDISKLIVEMVNPDKLGIVEVNKQT